MFTWLENNGMTDNPKNVAFLLVRKKIIKKTTNYLKIYVNGVKISSNLKSQIWNMQKKASQNLNVFTGITSYINQTKRIIIIKLKSICNLIIACWYEIMHNKTMIRN